MYKEYYPNILLSPYIETYWVSSDSIQGEQTIRVLPDGCVDILFNWNEKSFTPQIIGTITTCLNVTYINNIRMMGIRFRPCGISAFTQVPVNEFTDARVDISLFKTIFEMWFFEQMAEIKDDTDKINFMDSYLVKRIKNTFSLNNQIVHAVDLIRETKGTLPVSVILNDICLCERQFERKFKAMIGITPKTFSSITRFANTKKILHSTTNESLFSIALECGYYDHAHLIREHKRFAGDLHIR